MPDLPSLLAAAAAAAQPAAQPEFASLRARASRRAARRRTAAVVAVVSVLVLVGVAFATGLGGSSAQPAARPCVLPSGATPDDVVAVVPASGSVTVDVFAGDYLSIGWESCAESGTFTVPVSAKSMLSGLYGTSGTLSSTRMFVFGTGTTTIAGDGSAGSHGTIVVRSTYRPEPVGMSSASPYPTNPHEYEAPELCKAGDVAGDDGYLTRSVTYGSFQHLLEPPGDVRSRWTQAEILDTASRGDFRMLGPRVTAIFGLLTAENYGGGRRLPRWLVYQCDLPSDTFRGSGGGAIIGPTPAPGTSPSPFGKSYQTQYTLYDENRHPVYQGVDGYPDDATLAQRFVEVPFVRNHQDSADGRQIGISYPTYPCATFSHLDGGGGDQTGDIQVRVWLRITGAVPCDPNGTADAVVGLAYPLGERALVRGQG